MGPQKALPNKNTLIRRVFDGLSNAKTSWIIKKWMLIKKQKKEIGRANHNLLYSAGVATWEEWYLKVH